MLKALIFDCDGVIAETERDGHRVAFNKTFKEFGIDAEWDVEEYGRLVKISGGKERMKNYFQNHPELLDSGEDPDELVLKLHKRKTEIFMEMAAKGEMPVRPGINRIFDEAYEKGLILAICSTSNEKSVKSLVKALMGEQRLEKFHGILAGDIVKRKKPHPDIYELVKERFNLEGNECIVVEDTENGLKAAKAAGMYCIVTPSFYSHEEDFSEADIVVSSLGDPQLTEIGVIKASLSLDREVKYITIDDLNKIVK